MNESWPLSAAARELASAGVPVFPCAPDGKRPLTEHGFRDATTSAGQVEAWWRSTPAANVGIPTGAVSGVVVVDVDVHGPVNGYDAFARADRAGLVDGWEVLARTPSGGMHAYYPATLDGEERSWQAARAGVDFRGDGGYIVAPPSRRRVNGHEASYLVETINPGPAFVLDSARLRHFLDPRPTPRARPADRGVDRAADVSRLASWVARRQEGERNRGLFWAACTMAENGISPADALDVLTAAAGHAGLSEREAVTTVRSAYRTVQGPSPRNGYVRGSPTVATPPRRSTAREPAAPGLS